MAQNYIGEGNTISTLLGKTVESGELDVIEDVAGVYLTDGLSGETVEFSIAGMYEVPKTAGAAWDQGEKLYFVVATGAVGTVESTNPFAGIAGAPAESADTKGALILNGNGR